MIIEILLSILVSCVVWFFIFQIKLMYDTKKILKDIVKKIEKQNKKFFNDGKEVNIKKELISQSPKVSKKPIKPPNLFQKIIGFIINRNWDLK